MKRFGLTLSIICCFTFLASDVIAQSKEGKRRGPPPQAIEACADLSENDTCSFEGRRGAVEGTCRLSPEGEAPLACAPARRGRR